MESWGGILAFWHFEDLEIWDFGDLRFWNFWHFGIWRFGILGFWQFWHFGDLGIFGKGEEDIFWHFEQNRHY